MGFLDSLRQNNKVLGTPAGGTYGNEMYYGQPPIRNTGGDIDIVGLMNEARNRDLHDFAAKTRITGDEAIRQENYKRMYDPDRFSTGGAAPTQNTVYQRPPSELQQIGPLDLAKLGLEKEKIETAGGIDKAELGLKTKGYELDKLKNEQIYGTKQAEMERKADETNKRLQLAYDQLQAKQGDASSTAAYHQAQIDATNARH